MGPYSKATLTSFFTSPLLSAFFSSNADALGVVWGAGLVRKRMGLAVIERSFLASHDLIYNC